MSKDKKSKKLKGCSSSKRLLWFVYSGVAIGIRGLATLSLVAIAIKLHPLKYQANFFNTCVEESIKDGRSISTAVNFCNGAD